MPDGLTRTLQKTAPLVLTGLAVVLPLRVGPVQHRRSGPADLRRHVRRRGSRTPAGGLGILGAVLGMVAGIVAGAFIGFIAGVLKATRGVHEVITTIMLNYIAAGVTWWLVTGPLQAESSKTSGIPQTELIPEGAQVGAVAGIPIGFVIAVAARGRVLVDAVAHHPGLPVQHRGRQQARRRATPASTSTGSSPCRWSSAVAWPVSPARSRPRARSTGSSRPSAAPSASTASPSRCSRGPTRWRRIPAAFLVGVLRTGAAGPAVRDRHRPRGRRPPPRDHPAHGLHPRARQVDLPQPGRQGHRRVDELGELT